MFDELIEEWDTDLRSGDPLAFPGYAALLAELPSESVRTGRTEDVAVIAGEFGVLGGSMGVVHGEKVVRAYDRAVAARLPVVVVTRSGGARMQEGMVSLIQMQRTAAAAARHRAAGLLSIAVHRSPTTGGVFASYGSLCLLQVAEADATIGFAGPRVVMQTLGEAVEGRSHAADTAFAAHLVDAVVATDEVVPWVEAALGIRDAPLVVRPLPDPASEPTAPGAWGEVLRARRRGRPSGIDAAAVLCTSWTELGAGVDDALRVGLATVGGRRVLVVASDRYAGTGRPMPAGFALVQRGLALAAQVHLPVVSFVDLSGADIGPVAENAGIAREIARTLAAFASLPTPSVCVCVGEGGSGGAMALAACDRLLIQRHAIFSVIGPEGAAAILHRDADLAPQVAEPLRLTSQDLLDLGVVDDVIGETGADVQVAVCGALASAVPGERLRRADAVSQAWVRT
ncbi:MAG: acetyl-CoA carboxyl transferase [Actinomycetota bacterium]|nr:acetyl-CoA carboxyl transferase [Actinomycetota bacterium]